MARDYFRIHEADSTIKFPQWWVILVELLNLSAHGRRSILLDDWKPVSRPGAIIALSLYALFLLYAAFDRSGFLFLDFANLAIHEAGHRVFGFLADENQVGFGYILMVLGGTLLELIVPLACTIYFFFRREIAGTAFCIFWFFENFPYIGTYMADARMESLPLVGGGLEHDWEILFTHWHLMLHDQQIGHSMVILGRLGMLASVLWFAYRALRGSSQASACGFFLLRK